MITIEKKKESAENKKTENLTAFVEQMRARGLVAIPLVDKLPVKGVEWTSSDDFSVEAWAKADSVGVRCGRYADAFDIVCIDVDTKATEIVELVDSAIARHFSDSSVDVNASTVYVEESRHGWHYFIKSTPHNFRNEKLYYHDLTDDEREGLAKAGKKQEADIETKAKGGYVRTAPSAGIVARGSILDLTTIIDADVVSAILDDLRREKSTATVKEPPRSERRTASTTNSVDDSVADELRAQPVRVVDYLVARGWRIDREDPARWYLQRPDAVGRGNHSITIARDGGAVSVWSSQLNAEQSETISPLNFIASEYFNSDCREATRALGRSSVSAGRAIQANTTDATTDDAEVAELDALEIARADVVASNRAYREAVDERNTIDGIIAEREDLARDFFATDSGEPGSFQALANGIAEFFHCRRLTSSMVGLALLSGFVGEQFKLIEPRAGHGEKNPLYPRLATCIVGRPSSGKTSLFNEWRALFDEYDARISSEIRGRIAGNADRLGRIADIKKELSQARRNRAKLERSEFRNDDDVAVAVEEVKRLEADLKQAESNECANVLPETVARVPSLFSTPETTQGLIDDIRVNLFYNVRNGLTVCHDEATRIFCLNGLQSRPDVNALSVLSQILDTSCKKQSIRTASALDIALRASASEDRPRGAAFCLATQTKRFAKIYNNPDVGGQGILSRISFIYLPMPKTEEFGDVNVDALRADFAPVVAALFNMPADIVFTLSADGWREFVSHQRRLRAMMREIDRQGDDKRAEYIGKVVATILRVSMLARYIAYADGQQSARNSSGQLDTVIDAETVRRSARLVDMLIEEQRNAVAMCKVDGKVEASEAMTTQTSIDIIDRVVAYIDEAGEAGRTRRDIQRRFFNKKAETNADRERQRNDLDYVLRFAGDRIQSRRRGRSIVFYSATISVADC